MSANWHARGPGLMHARRRTLSPGWCADQAPLGVYSGKLQIPYEAFAAGLGDYHIITTLCPGGKERMR